MCEEGTKATAPTEQIPQASGDDSGERRSSLSRMSDPRLPRHVRTPPQVPGDRSGERRPSLSPSRHPRCLRPVLPFDPHGPSATSSSSASGPRGLRAPGSTFVSACTLCSRMCASVLAMLEYPAAPPCPVAAGAEQEAGQWRWGPAGSHGGQNAAQFGGWAARLPRSQGRRFRRFCTAEAPRASSTRLCMHLLLSP